MTSLPRAGRQLLLSALGFASAALPGLHAQTVAAPAPPPDGKSPIVMNPFEVSTSGDVGYLAQSSQAGSRLNTSLSDLATPVSVFTQEFLADTAVTSVDELAKYMPSTINVNAQAANLFIAQPNATLHTRGLPAATNTVDFFASPTRLDAYNLDRVEQSRGPNSILFGLGSPGGVINVSTNHAVLNRPFGSVENQTRSFESERTSLDANIPLLPNHFALRVDAVNDQRNTWRDQEYDNEQSIFLTGTYSPDPNTDIRVEWERGVTDKSIIQPSTATDDYTVWANAGGKLSTTANAAAGITTVSTTDWLSIDPVTGQALDEKGETQSAAHNSPDGEADFLTNFSILPKKVSLYAGVAFPYHANYTRGSVFAEHNFGHNLSAEFAANTTNLADYNYVGRLYTRLLVDTDPVLPTGAANPNAGRTFTEGYPGVTYFNYKAERARLSLAYSLDLGWFGSHQFAMLAERDLTSQSNGQKALYVSDNPYSLAAPDNAANQLHFRTYFNLNGPTSAMTAGDWRNVNLAHFVDQNGRAMAAQWLVSAQGSTAIREALNSEMAVVQSHFLKDYLITSIGYRFDQLQHWEGDGTRGPAYGSFKTGALYVPQPAGTPTTASPTNYALSGVLWVTPKKWLGISYNRAEDTALQSGNLVVSDQPPGDAHPGNPRGTSQDVGIKVNLGHRLSFTALYYRTSATHNFQSQSGLPETNFNTIWNALAAAGVISTSDAQAHATFENGYSYDSVGKGWELELTANPTDHWRVYANFSDGLVAEANIGAEGQAYLAKYQGQWLQGNNGRVLLDGSGGLAPTALSSNGQILTVADEVQAIQNTMNSLYILPEGQRSVGDIKRHINLLTTYDFSRGFLRGFFVGGGLRYLSGDVTSYSAATKRAFFGPGNTLVDADVGYQRDLRWIGRRVRWRIQLNVTNLLNNTQILPMKTDSIDGEVVNYRMQEPRAFILTNKLAF